MNQMHEYAGAHFNLLLAGNLVLGCQQNKTMPDPATANDAFECIAGLLPQIDALGIKFAFALGNFNRTVSMAGNNLGGAGTFGGVGESGVLGYPTRRNVAWAVAELRKRNLTGAVAQYVSPGTFEQMCA